MGSLTSDREGAALTVNSLGEFSLTALQQNHPRMFFVADLAAFGNWQLLEEIRDRMGGQREEGAVTAEGTEDGFLFLEGQEPQTPGDRTLTGPTCMGTVLNL